MLTATARRRILLGLLLAGSACWAQSAPEKPAQRVSWTAEVMRQEESMRIPELSFSAIKLPVVLIPKGKELRPLVELRGKFAKPEWRLFIQDNSPVKPDPLVPEGFVVHLYLNSQVNELTFTAKNNQGQVQKETLYIFAPQAQEFQILSPWSALSLAFGYAGLTYEQTGFGVYSSRSGLLSAAYSTLESASRWGFSGQADITVANFDSEPILANPQVVDARFDGSFRLSYREHTRWRYRLLGGISYLTMISNGSPFGFANLVAPDLGLRSTYYWSTKSLFVVDLRAVPFKDVHFFNQRGLHMTLTWSKTLKSTRRQDISLKFSDSRFKSNQQQIGVSLVTFSLGYSI